jgi:dihydropyrimidinase
VIFDPDAEQVISAKTHHMRVDYSMFEGMRVNGVTKTVLSRGRVIIDNGNFTGRPGAGEFLRRKTYTGAG